MSEKRKHFEEDLVVINVQSKDDTVILELRFTKPRFKEPPKAKLEDIIQPMPASQMERMGSDMAKGYMSVLQKQLQQQMQQLGPFIPSSPPPNTIRINLSKEEYVGLGRPTIDDKLTLTLKMKTL